MSSVTSADNASSVETTPYAVGFENFVKFGLNLEFVKNEKGQFVKGLKPKLPSRWEAIDQDRYKNETNFSVLTGPVNDLILFDFDKPKFNEKDGLEWFQKLFGSVQDCFGLITESPSGGLHCYSKYDECVLKNITKLKNEQNLDLSLDIKTKGGMGYQGLHYAVIKNDAILPLPEKFKLYMKDYYKKTKDSQTKKKTTKLGSDNYEMADYFQLALPDETIEEVLQLVNNDCFLVNYQQLAYICKNFNKIEIYRGYWKRSGHYDQTIFDQQWSSIVSVENGSKLGRLFDILLENGINMYEHIENFLPRSTFFDDDGLAATYDKINRFQETKDPRYPNTYYPSGGLIKFFIFVRDTLRYCYEIKTFVGRFKIKDLI